MSLNAQWSDEELPELIALLNRAMNCWDPKLVPKWAWQLEAAAVARMNDLKAAKPVDPAGIGVFMISENEIQRVMSETGMDYIQARNHIKCRILLKSMSPSAIVRRTTSHIVSEAENVAAPSNGTTTSDEPGSK